MLAGLNECLSVYPTQIRILTFSRHLKRQGLTFASTDGDKGLELSCSGHHPFPCVSFAGVQDARFVGRVPILPRRDAPPPNSAAVSDASRHRRLWRHVRHLQRAAGTGRQGACEPDCLRAPLLPLASSPFPFLSHLNMPVS